MKSVLDGVVSDADIAVITRRDAEDAVVMSLDHYNSLMETVHLLKSPANAAHLAESIEQFRAGKVVERDTVGEHQWSRRLAWTHAAWADYVYWQTQDRKTLRPINRLLSDTMRSPFEAGYLPPPERFSAGAARR